MCRVLTILYFINSNKIDSSLLRYQKSHKLYTTTTSRNFTREYISKTKRKKKIYTNSGRSWNRLIQLKIRSDLHETYTLSPKRKVCIQSHTQQKQTVPDTNTQPQPNHAKPIHPRESPQHSNASPQNHIPLRKTHINTEKRNVEISRKPGLPKWTLSETITHKI